MLHTSLRPPARPMVGGRKVDKERFLRGGYCIAYMIKDTYYAGGARGVWGDQPQQASPQTVFHTNKYKFQFIADIGPTNRALVGFAVALQHFARDVRDELGGNTRIPSRVHDE